MLALLAGLAEIALRTEFLNSGILRALHVARPARMKLSTEIDYSVGGVSVHGRDGRGESA